MCSIRAPVKLRVKLTINTGPLPYSISTVTAPDDDQDQATTLQWPTVCHGESSV